VTGYAVFGVALLVPRLLAGTELGAFFEAHPTAPHFIVKTILLAFTLAAVWISGRRSGPGSGPTWGHYGFRRPIGARWLRAAGLGGLLGAAATAGILLTPAEGVPGLRSFGFLGLVFSVWLYSSVTEELFVRGWLQSSLRDAFPEGGSPVVISGLFFGSMHLSLIPSGADWWTVVILVTATTLLGFQTAHLRRRTESLLPPIAAHVAFNVGGLLAGILVNLVAILRTGAPIQP
jgi:membrane protease YdiL (CAAX protease family)